MKSIYLKPGKELPSLRFHPWIFSGALQPLKEEIQDGETVEIFSSKKEKIGTGHFQNGSIAVRLFSFGSETINRNYWKDKFYRALQIRNNSAIITPDTNAYRLVFGEGDGMPGLIADYYNGNIVLQAHSIGMHLLLDDFKSILLEVYENNIDTIYDKSKESLPRIYSEKIQNKTLYGNQSETIIKENGCSFYVNWMTGQKTGFFIDQRENRKLLQNYCKNKNVLNTFCYTGGFSVYAGTAGATEVHSVDVSEKATVLTKKNMELNSLPIENIYTSDTFDFMNGKENYYDVIILDPPAFAKHRDAKHNAMLGYKRLNTEAFRIIRKGGTVFTFSCSGVVDRDLFEGAVRSAAINAKREVKILQRLSQPADHPVSIFHPEGEYLKGLILTVN